MYLSDTQVGPVDLYRTLAWELGIEPAFRRVALWRDLKSRLLHMVDERDERPVIIIDDAHHLSERFLSDFSGFLNFAFDSRDLFTTWLVGHTELRTRLKLYRYTALRTRIVASVHLEPHTKREVFAKFLSHGLAAAGAKKTIFTDSAHELLFRASGGLARDVSKIVRRAFRIADERELSFVDDGVMEAAIGEAAEL